MNNILNEWDPIGLIIFAPEDEYAKEAEDICKQLNKEMTLEEIANIIYTVFEDLFGEVFEASYEECFEIAKKVIL